MFRKLTLRPLTVGVLVTLIVAVLIVINNVSASQACKQVKGDFTLTAVTGPACNSPIGLCATGVYRGSIRGTSTFTASGMIQTADTLQTDVVFVTGDSQITTDGGVLLTKDAMSLRTVLEGTFAKVDVNRGGGTGDWANTTGLLTANGTFILNSGGSGTYSGEICTH